jgi:hypothetical protein
LKRAWAECNNNCADLLLLDVEAFVGTYNINTERSVELTKNKDADDTWPQPDFAVGHRDHVHAIGVISLLTAQFERSIDSFHAHHWHLQNAPDELIDLYFYSLNEEKRLEAIRTAFEKFEQDPAVREAIENLIQYFKWCRDARNNLLHAEHYPASFGGDPALLYLMKRTSKSSTTSGYMKLSLEYLRSIAGKIRAGIVQSAKISIYLRIRGLPPEEIERETGNREYFWGRPHKAG